MSWKHFLKTKVSKTTIWLILFGIIITSFVYIILDETCTFHINKLIEVPTQSDPSSRNIPTKPTEYDESAREQDIDEMEVKHNDDAFYFVESLLSHDHA